MARRAPALRRVRRISDCPDRGRGRSSTAGSTAAVHAGALRETAPHAGARVVDARPAVPGRLRARRTDGRLLDDLGDPAADHRVPVARGDRRMELRRGAHGHGLVHLPRGHPRRCDQPEPRRRGRPRPQRNSRLHLAQAGRRAVPRLDDAPPAVACHQHADRGRHLRLGVPAPRPGADARCRRRRRGRDDGRRRGPLSR